MKKRSPKRLLKQSFQSDINRSILYSNLILIFLLVICLAVWMVTLTKNLLPVIEEAIASNQGGIDFTGN